MGVVVAFIAWVVTLIVLATDLTAFGIVKNGVNGDGTGSSAYYGSALWCLLSAFIIQFFGMVIVFFTCCSARRQKRKGGVVVEPKTDYGVQRRGRWSRFRRH